MALARSQIPAEMSPGEEDKNTPTVPATVTWS